MGDICKGGYALGGVVFAGLPGFFPDFGRVLGALPWIFRRLGFDLILMGGVPFWGLPFGLWGRAVWREDLPRAKGLARMIGTLLQDIP